MQQLHVQAEAARESSVKMAHWAHEQEMLVRTSEERHRRTMDAIRIAEQEAVDKVHAARQELCRLLEEVSQAEEKAAQAKSDSSSSWQQRSSRPAPAEALVALRHYFFRTLRFVLIILRIVAKSI